MNILILGSGGREYTFAWKISQSEACENIFIAPGNAGTSEFGTNIDMDTTDFPMVANFVRESSIGLIVVGPEVPLVAGIRDYFEAQEDLKHVLLVGPGKAGAQLEGSKDFSKAFMEKYGIPAARSMTFTAESLNEGLAYLEYVNFPIVLKADGLAAGKGVIIAKDLDEARASLEKMLGGQFGSASEKVLIEDYLDGIELSVFVLTDGKNYVILPEAKDYKRIGDKDTGLNTGGMGAVSPVFFANDAFMDKVKTRIVEPTIDGLNSENIDFKGFIFIGLMKVNNDPYVIEYNVRMGDPETQVVLPRIDEDFLTLLIESASGQLQTRRLETIPDAVSTVVMVAGGYPASYEKGHVIKGLADVPSELIVVHAGTKQHKYEVLTNGGRVLSVTGIAPSLEDAIKQAYKGIQYISWKDCYFRKDIGKDVLAYHLD